MSFSTLYRSSTLNMPASSVFQIKAYPASFQGLSFRQLKMISIQYDDRNDLNQPVSMMSTDEIMKKIGY